MASLGALGALGGLGQGTTNLGEMLRQRWLANAQEEQERAREGRQDQREMAREGRANQRALDAETRQATREDERETRRNTRDDTRDATDHQQRLEEIRETGKFRTTGGDAEGEPGSSWTSGGNTFSKDLNGDTWMLDPESQQWVNVGAPGKAPLGGLSREELMLEAEDYADSKISEQAKWTNLDSTDFADHGGSRATAREAYIQEFLQGRGAGGSLPPASPTPNTPPGADPSTPGLDTPPGGIDEDAAYQASLSTPPAAAPAAAGRTRIQDTDTARPARTGGGRSDRETMQVNLQRAKAAIANGAPRDAVVKRLEENGYTAEEIQLYGI